MVLVSGHVIQNHASSNLTCCDFLHSFQCLIRNSPSRLPSVEIMANPMVNSGRLPADNMTEAKAVSTVSKPVMRGLLNSSIKRNLIVSLSLAALSGVAFKYLVAEPRKKKYAEFYRNYDSEKEFEEMRKKGLFQSC